MAGAALGSHRLFGPPLSRARRRRLPADGAQREASKRRINSSLGYAFASHRTGRPAVEDERFDRVVGLAFFAAFDHERTKRGEPIEKAGNDGSRRAAQSSRPRRRPWPSALIPVGSQSFHLRPEGQHARGHAFVFFVTPLTLRSTAPWLTRLCSFRKNAVAAFLRHRWRHCAPGG